MFKRNREPKSINFLEPINTPSDVWAGTVNWLSNVGKTLLIIVEIVVIAAFFSRFILDRKNNDLADEVNSLVTVLDNSAWRQNSIKYDNLQKLLTDIALVERGQKLNSTVVSEITSSIPSSLNVKNLSFNGDRVSISIETTNFAALKEYEDSLKNNTYYSDVKFNISKSDSDLDVSVSFILSERV